MSSADAERRLNAGLAAVVQRGMVDRVEPDGAQLQALGLSGRPTPELEHFEPQGWHSKPPAGADLLLLSPCGDSGNSVAALAHARAQQPVDPTMLDGECGMHLLGEFKVYVAADGSVHLGMKMAPDFVGLASKIDAALAALVTWATTHTHPVPSLGTSGVSETPVGPAASVPVGSLVVKAV